MTLEPTFGRSAQGPVRVTHPYVTASGRASGIRSSALLAGARQNSQSAGGTGRALLRSKPSGRHVEPAADGATLNPGGDVLSGAGAFAHLGDRFSSRESGKGFTRCLWEVTPPSAR